MAVRAAAFVLIAIALVGAAAGEASTSAHLLVQKSVEEKQLVIGQNMTIKINLFNAGSGEATQVSVNDPDWDTKHFEIVTGAGSTSATFPSIAPGANVTHSFVVVPKVSGQFSAGPSMVSYKAGDTSEVTTGTSNHLPRLPILSTTEKHLAAALTFGRYMSLGFLKDLNDWKWFAIIGGGVGILLSGNWLALQGQAALAQHRRKKAIEGLTKDEKAE